MDGQDQPNNSEDDFAVASHSTADFIKHSGEHQPALATRRPERPKPRSLKPLLAIVIIVLLLAGLAGGYEFLKKHKSSKTSSTSTAVQATPAPTPTTSATKSISTYVSNGHDLNLSFNYPSDWSVSPSSNNNPKDQPITVTSPLTTLTAADGSSVTGKVVVSVRPGSNSISELTANNPTAALASSQIAYSQPTSSQYQYPFLSYLHFSTGVKVNGAFEEVMVTGEISFNKGDSIANSTLSGLDPVLSANFMKCSTQACSGSGATSLSINSNTWQNTPLCQQTLQLLESFKLN